MIDRADRDSVDRNPDAQARQAPPSTIASNRVAKLPHPPADQVGTYAYQSVSLPRNKLTLSAIVHQASPPQKAPALPACWAWLQSALASANAISAASRPPEQSGAHCSAAQRRYWTLKAASSRPCRVLSAELAATSIRVRLHFRDPDSTRASSAQPSPEHHLHACNTELNLDASFFPCSTAARRHGSTFRSPERGKYDAAHPSRMLPRPTALPATQQSTSASKSCPLQWARVHGCGVQARVEERRVHSYGGLICSHQGTQARPTSWNTQDVVLQRHTHDLTRQQPSPVASRGSLL